MQLSQFEVDQILMVVQLLAKSADDRRLSLMETYTLRGSVEALRQHESDDFVKHFLAAIKDAHGVLTRNKSQKKELSVESAGSSKSR
jgi:hypothetical protein